jgi:hypothetical protein
MADTVFVQNASGPRATATKFFAFFFTTLSMGGKLPPFPPTPSGSANDCTNGALDLVVYANRYV